MKIHDKAAAIGILKKINLSLDVAVARRLIKIEDEKRRESDSDISKLGLEHKIVVGRLSVGPIIVSPILPLQEYELGLVSEYQAYLNKEFYNMKNKKGL